MCLSRVPLSPALASSEHDSSPQTHRLKDRRAPAWWLRSGFLHQGGTE